jgi:hypothetical protein
LDENVGDAGVLSELAAFGLYTLLLDRPATICGQRVVQFGRAPDGGPSSSRGYLVDSPDLEALLRVIASCSGGGR